LFLQGLRQGTTLEIAEKLLAGRFISGHGFTAC
jgi:hypothetical protein